MEAAPEQSYHTHDEHLRDNPYLKPEASARVIEIAHRGISEEERDEPHEFNGFGD